MSAVKRLQIKSSTIDEERLNHVVSGGRLFGWKRNTYDAGSDQITLRFLFSARDVPYDSLHLQQWLLSPAHTHEVGHYMLSSATRLGITLRKVSALLDGLVPIVAEEMVKETGKIWLPFKDYVEIKSPIPRTVQLVKAVYKLDSLRSKLTNGWRITHELFALCWSVLFGMARRSALSVLGPSKEETIWAMSVVSDKARVDKVIETLSRVLGRDSIFQGKLPEPADWEELARAADSVFSSPEKEEALDVLRALQIFSSRILEKHYSNIDMDREVDRACQDSMEETMVAFAEGDPEHRAALKLFEKFGDSPANAGKIMVIIGLLSNLYAPSFAASELFRQDERIAGVPEVDRILEYALNRFMKQPLEQLMGSAEQVSREIDWIQKKLDGIAIRSLSHLQIANVLGSIEWFEELFRVLQLNRRQKNIIRGLLAGSQIENDEFLRIVSTQGRSFVPRFTRPLFHLFLACRRWLTPRLSELEKVYHALESLGFTSFRSIENAIALFYPLILSFEFMDAGRWCSPTVSVCYDQKGVVLALGANAEDIRVQHAVLRSLLDALRHGLLTPSKESPAIFCPVGAMGKSSYLSCEQVGGCIMMKLSNILPEDTLVVCGKENTARLLRKEQARTGLREVGQIGFTVHESVSEDSPEKGRSLHTGKREQSPPSRSEKEHGTQKPENVHPFIAATAKGIMNAVGVLGAPLALANYLWVKKVERQKNRIDRNTSRSVYDMWILLNKLADADTKKTV